MRLLLYKANKITILLGKGKTMKLSTKELVERFKKYPLYSQDGKGMESTVLVKYFNPCGVGTWLITEAEEQENGDWLLFGYCHIHC